MIENQRVDRTAFRKAKKDDVKSDFAFWQAQPYVKRLEALELIRQEYIKWKYDTNPGFQRVITIRKKPSIES